MATTTTSRDKTLLIVEDTVLIAMVLKDELEDAGYRVLELTSRYEEAMTQARDGKPDMALVNIQLHGKDDGIRIAADFKVILIPVLFISGQSDRARSVETGAIASLPKPYRAADMVLAVDYLFGCMNGNGMLPRPTGLEVFANAPTGLTAGAA